MIAGWRSVSWRVAVVLAICTSTLLLGSAPASAHGDDRLVHDTLELEPGEMATFPGGLHYHRLVGRFEADGAVAIWLTDTRSGQLRASAGPAATVTINELVRCCDDAVFAPHELVVQNVSSHRISVDATARLVHDDLAVMVDGAESGTRPAVVILGAWLAWAVWRARRSERAPTSLARTAAGFTGLIATMLALGLLGAARYGVEGAPALVAGAGSLPILPANPIVSRASLLLGVGIFGWGVSVVRWVRSAPTSPRLTWALVGTALIAAPIVTAVWVADGYGAAGPPAVMATVACVPVLAVLVLDGRSGRRLAVVPGTVAPWSREQRSRSR